MRIAKRILRPKQVICIVAAILVLGSAIALGVRALLQEPEPEPLTAIEPDELVEAVDTGSLEGLSGDERSAALVENGYRMGLVRNEDLHRYMLNPEVWKSMYALSEADRIDFMLGMMTSRLERDVPWMEKVLEASPEKQQKMLDEEIDRAQWINRLGKGLSQVGVIPTPQEEQRAMRSYFNRAGHQGRKLFYRRVLNLTDSRSRAVAQEYRRRLVERGRKRGIDLERMERGDYQ